MLLGAFYGESENKETEFKEFYLKISPDSVLSLEEINFIVANGIYLKKLNKLIFLNLKKYLIYYLPKYLSCFINTKINGKLIFGVNDIGEITGIPYLGQIKINKIYQFINNIVSKYLDGIDDISQYYDIKFVKLNKDINILDDSADEYIQDMNKRNLRYKTIIEKYIKDKKLWLEKIAVFNTKILEILNNLDLRDELIKFIEKFSTNKIIIQLLETQHKFSYDKDMYYRIKDRNHIFFWVAKFKDFKINELQKIKPRKKNLPSLVNNSMILSKISNMRYRFIKNNKNLNFYIIEINIKNNNNIYSRYRLPYSELWCYRTRVCDIYGPGCI